MDIDALPPRDRDELLSAYLDGELPDEQAREVTTWLERHPAALAEAERLRRLWDLLGRYPDEPVPAGFAARALAAAGVAAAPQAAPAPAARRRWGGSRPAWFAAAASLLVAVGAGALALRGPGVAPTAEAAGLLEAIDADFVANADLGAVLALSDQQFDSLLLEDPAAVAAVTDGTSLR